MGLKEVLAAFRGAPARSAGAAFDVPAGKDPGAAGGTGRLSRVFLNLDKVIKIIRTEDEPKPKLMKAFSLTEVQAEAILNMRLRALRKLEEMQIRGEHDSLTKERKELTK
jgi:hypothetical protein